MLASTMASNDVGTCIKGTPRLYVAAINPAKSPTTPPPKATILFNPVRFSVSISFFIIIVLSSSFKDKYCSCVNGSSKKASKPLKNKKRIPKKPVSEPSISSDAPVEERFREMVKEVKQRVFSVNLKKDDFKTYSEVQSDIDSFLNEALSEILSIKNNLKAKFDKIQSANVKAKRPNQSRSRSRKPRERKPADEKKVEEAE